MRYLCYGLLGVLAGMAAGFAAAWPALWWGPGRGDPFGPMFYLYGWISAVPSGLFVAFVLSPDWPRSTGATLRLSVLGVSCGLVVGAIANPFLGIDVFRSRWPLGVFLAGGALAGLIVLAVHLVVRSVLNPER